MITHRPTTQSLNHPVMTTLFTRQKATLNQGLLVQRENDADEAEGMPDGAGMENEYLAFTVALDYAF